MGNKHISRDVKLAAIQLHNQGILSTLEILDCVGFSRHTFLYIQNLYHETGDVVSRPHNGLLVRHRPDRFLNELTTLLQENQFISAHYTTIHCELSRSSVSYKKLNKVAKERNEDLRADFM
ncbi:hypothetical protein EV363DRAFT_1409892 [Boletus edulis]|uniref:Transposase n=1 Tax=Boletus edulis BED1 TaxID=1328754 RepID=A0AAD4GFG5_BOLED|nr:hypothetical protein EV363DRAFT_1409892 [Boletus edulis]KAF8441783.1 hypothetical protein L210DRAFT_962446 [Boletus edulis BED1]